MSRRRSQAGITLVVSLIMLIVLTLLVVSAVRFGNINLRIAGNAQAEAEASAAAQVAIERTIAEIDATADLDGLEAKSVAVSTGGGTYTVAITKPSCVTTANINAMKELNAKKADDQVCYGGGTGDLPLGAGGELVEPPTECKKQLWDFQAGVNDAATGASVSMLQGVQVRVGAEIECL